MGVPSAKAFDSEGWPRISRLAPGIAPAAIEMVLHRARWIHRRVESIALLDEARIRRRISLDLTVPDQPQGVPGDLVFLPVTLLGRQVLSKFDVRDETGAALSMLTKQQHDAVATTMVLGMAGQALAEAVANGRLPAADRDLHPYIADALRRTVVNPPPHLPPDPLEPWLKFHDKRIRTQAEVIDAHGETRTLIDDLALLFIVFVPLVAKPGDRRVLKLAFEESLPRQSGRLAQAPPLSLRDRLSGALLLRPYPFVIAVSGGQSASYHAELEAPEDLSVADAHLARKVGTARVRIAEAGVAADRAHLHPGPIARGDDVELLAELMLRPSGLLPAATLISGLTTLTLIAGLLLHAGGVTVSGAAASAVVVILPAVFAPFLAVAATHRLVQRIVRYARLLLTGVTAISFVAASSLVIDFHADVRVLIWIVLTVASLIPTLAFALAWNKARAVT